MDFEDNRPAPLTWQEEFGDKEWNDPEVDRAVAKESVLTLVNCMKGRKVNQESRKAAEFIAARKAWPIQSETNNVTINVIRSEQLQEALRKAGILPKPVEVISVSHSTSPERQADTPIALPVVSDAPQSSLQTSSSEDRVTLPIYQPPNP